MTVTAPRYAEALHEIGLSDADRFGRKAATLGALLADGFPVPPGFVLSADALSAALDAAGLAGEPTADQVRALPLPPEVALALAVGYERIAGVGGAVAVRSSGAAEDSADRSYAGQYESVLNVVGAEAVADAVRECWASAFADRVSRYAPSAPAGPAAAQVRMAVLVQPMVAADAAGVAFTVNPVTGADETVVEAVRGLGDRLAAGHVTPEAWSVRDGRAHRVSGDQRALDAAVAAEIATVAGKAAAALGAPQDVEWAVEGRTVVLLQSRPITAVPVADGGRAVSESVPEGFWLRGNYSLKPLSPMNVGTVLRAVNRCSPDLFRYALGSRIEVRSVGGWSYVRFVQSQDPAELRAGLAGIAGALRAGEPRAIVRRWRTRWEPAAAARVQRMRSVDLAALSDRELLSQITRRLAFAERMQRLHFLVGGASTIEWGELGALCERTLGWDVARVLDLLVGLPGKTTEPTVAMAPLVAVAQRDRLRPLLLADPRPAWADVADADPEFAAAGGDYLVRYGQRVLGADIAEPTLQERPESLLALVADAVAADRDPAREIARAAEVREAAIAEAAAALAAHPASLRQEFAALLDRAQDAYPLRDDTAFYGHVAWGLFRYSVLALAARLVAGGRLATEDDVFLLTVDEAAAALTGGEDQRGLAAHRAAEVAHAAEHRGPLTLGTPTGPPARLADILADLDAADRDRLAVVQWADAAYRIGMERTEQQGDLLRGVGASPGSYTGPARILFSEADFGKLRPGDVLVCPETTAQWSVLFGSVGALVTDTGGMLSHPAVIAREYRVPAVVATGNATRLLRDGQLVTVDGRAGLVEIVGAAGEAAEAPAAGTAADLSGRR